MTRIRMIRTVLNLCFLIPATSFAAGSLNVTGIQLKGGGQVEIQMDAKVDPAFVKVEYLRDIIQLNLHNATIYPAKILPSHEADLKKVFAYQYNAKLVRCRLSVADDAEKYRNRFQLKVQGSKIIVTLLSEEPAKSAKAGIAKTAPKTDSVVTQKAEATSESSVTGESKEGLNLSPDSQALLGQVLKEKSSEKLSEIKSAEKLESRASKTLTNGQTGPNPMRSFMWLGVLLAMIGGATWVLKKMKSKGMGNAISRWTGKKFGASPKMIDVVASHYLGPKKSIAVVRIKNQHMVIGISDESINLIAQLNSEDEASEWLDGNPESTPTMDQAYGHATKKAATQPSFSDALQAQLGPKTTAPVAVIKTTPSIPAGANQTYRDQIRKRLEGMKSL